VTIPEQPAWVSDCNCSICRRYGVLWSYFIAKTVQTEASPEALARVCSTKASVIMRKKRATGSFALATAVILVLSITAWADGDAEPDLLACKQKVEAGSFAAAIDTCSRALDLDLSSDHRTYALNLRAVAYANSGDTDRAIADLSSMIALDDSNATTYVSRASLYYAKGDLDPALDDFAAALRRTPENFSIYGERGWVYLARRDYERARKDFDALYAKDPSNLLASSGRGTALFALERYSEANETFHEIWRGFVGPEVTLWLLIAELRAGDLHGQSSEDFALGDADPNAWPAPLIKYLRGEGSEADVDSAAAAAAKPAVSDNSASPDCQAAFYLGEYDLALGQNDAGLARLRHAFEVCRVNTFEGIASEAELRRLAP